MGEDMSTTQQRVKTRILFLCTGNSCRSQMAQGWAEYLRGDYVETRSAGSRPQGLNPDAVLVMREAGVDISRQRSKHVDSVRGEPFDFVVTLCGAADEICLVFPGAAKQIHVPFDDPPALAKTARTREEQLAHYRRVRDEIRSFIENIPENLEAAAYEK